MLPDVIVFLSSVGPSLYGGFLPIYAANTPNWLTFGMKNCEIFFNTYKVNLKTNKLIKAVYTN